MKLWEESIETLLSKFQKAVKDAERLRREIETKGGVNTADRTSIDDSVLTGMRYIYGELEEGYRKKFQWEKINQKTLFKLHSHLSIILEILQDIFKEKEPDTTPW